MADFFFFTDTAHLENQNSSDQAFGPVAGNETTQFCVTSLHKGKIDGDDRIDPIVYSISDGDIRIQKDNTDSELVNLILAPSTQIIPSLKIKYFIYRGIRKDSLIDAAGKFVANDLTNKLDEQNTEDDLGLAFKSAIDNPTPGFEREDNDSIDSIFFEQTDIKPIPVNAGDSMGKFNGEGFAFEIILENPFFEQTLGEVRNTLSTDGLIINISSFSETQKKYQKERILSYIDPAAFFGMFSMSKTNLSSFHYFNENVKDDNVRISSAQNLYDIILTKFHNRNKIYLDIRNENNLSYNFYDIYNNGNGNVLLSLKNTDLQIKKKKNTPIKPTDSDVLLRNYNTLGWPLLMLNSEDFHLSLEATKSPIRFCLANETDSIMKKIFIEVGTTYYDFNGKKKSINKEEEPYLLNEKNRFHDVNIEEKTWTGDIILSNAVINDGQEKGIMSFYFKLHYIRQYEQSQQGKHIPTKNNWDNMFIIKPKVNSKFNNSNLTSWNLTGHSKYTYSNGVNKQFYKGISDSAIALEKNPVSLEYSRIIFYYVNSFLEHEGSFVTLPQGLNKNGTGGNQQTTNSFFILKETDIKFSGSSKLVFKKISEQKNPLLATEDDKLFLQYEDGRNTRKRRASYSQSIYAFAFSFEEYESITDLLVNFDVEAHPVFLQINDIDHPRENWDEECYTYQRYTLKLVGYNSLGEYHEIDILDDSLSGNMTLYSLMSDVEGGCIFTTQAAAKLELVPIEKDPLSVFDNVLIEGTWDGELRENYEYSLQLLKQFNPEQMSRLREMGLYGVPVYFHDKIGVKQYKQYKIKVIITDDPPTPFTNNQAGKVELNRSKDDSKFNFYIGKIFGRSNGISSLDPMLFNLDNLTTIDEASQPGGYDDTYGSFNMTRYVNLHIDKLLNSSSLNEQLLHDYTKKEIIDGLFDNNKIYLESKINLDLDDFNYNDTETDTIRKRTTLNNMKLLGVGTLNPNIPIPVYINKSYFKSANDTFKPPPQSPPKPPDKAISINGGLKIKQLTETLSHELGHAEYDIKEPTISEIWHQIESLFKGRINDFIETVISKEGGSTKQINSFNDLVLNPNYPLPIDKEYTGDILIDDKLENKGFLAKTGGGHLRGNPNALFTCSQERFLGENLYRKNEEDIKEAYVSRGYNRGMTEFVWRDPDMFFDYRYSYLNYDDANFE